MGPDPFGTGKTLIRISLHGIWWNGCGLDLLSPAILSGTKWVLL